MDDEQFSVYRYREDGTYSYVRQSASLEQAIEDFCRCVFQCPKVVVSDGNRRTLVWTSEGGFRRG
jgi:hypothetical protein